MEWAEEQITECGGPETARAYFASAGRPNVEEWAEALERGEEVDVWEGFSDEDRAQLEAFVNRGARAEEPAAVATSEPPFEEFSDDYGGGR